MAFDITIRHPAFRAFASSWQLMRDAIDGEDAIKSRGEAYLPMKSGTAAIADATKKQAAYDAYKMRAEFPELVAPTVRGTVGTMLDQAAAVELPEALEPLRERATRNGMPLDVLHLMIATEVMSTGRYGLLPGLDSAGVPYIAGYSTESIINWDVADDVPIYVVLDETGDARNPETNSWERVERFLECSVESGVYQAREWLKSGSAFVSAEPVGAVKPPRNGKRDALSTLPFVFINTNGLQADPDDVPLYGLAKLAARIYRLDADYTFSMHMTSEPTPVAIGFDDPKSAIADGLAPTSIGSSKLWLLPKGGDAKFLEFQGASISAQKDAIQAALDRAVALGAQILADRGRSAESGEAMSMRLGHQSSILKLVAKTTAAGLERALKNLAVWMGANPEEVKVTPKLDFFDHTLSAQEITAIVKGWMDGAYSWRSAFDRLQKGGIIPADRAPDDEEKMIAEDDAKRGATPDQEDLIDPVSGKPIKRSLIPLPVPAQQ